MYIHIYITALQEDLARLQANWKLNGELQLPTYSVTRAKRNALVKAIRLRLHSTAEVCCTLYICIKIAWFLRSEMADMYDAIL